MKVKKANLFGETFDVYVNFPKNGVIKAFDPYETDYAENEPINFIGGNNTAFFGIGTGKLKCSIGYHFTDKNRSDGIGGNDILCLDVGGERVWTDWEGIINDKATVNELNRLISQNNS